MTILAWLIVVGCAFMIFFTWDFEQSFIWVVALLGWLQVAVQEKV